MTNRTEEAITTARQQCMPCQYHLFGLPCDGCLADRPFPWADGSRIRNEDTGLALLWRSARVDLLRFPACPADAPVASVPTRASPGRLLSPLQQAALFPGIAPACVGHRRCCSVARAAAARSPNNARGTAAEAGNTPATATRLPGSGETALVARLSPRREPVFRPRRSRGQLTRNAGQITTAIRPD